MEYTYFAYSFAHNIVVGEDEDEAGFEEVIQQLTDVFGMETLRYTAN